jgi:SAM-dependent methyltransferase
MADALSHDDAHLEAKHERYCTGKRAPLVDVLADHRPMSGRALDVGCSTGGLGAELLSRGFAQVIGVEPMPAIAELARANLTDVVVGTFQSVDRAPLGAFDLIVFADSLEHMLDPWTALTNARQMLNPGGAILLSVPNVAHWSVLWRAWKMGRWDYQEEGLLDRSHLRFFTPITLAETLDRAGFDVIGSMGREKRMPKRRRWMRPILLRLWPHLLVFQQYVVAVPSERIVTSS